MEINFKQPEENLGLQPERFGCHFCERTFKSKPSRSNHHKRLHPNKHACMKGHRMSPDHLCKHCGKGYRSRRSRWNHEQRCQSNPEVLKQLKMMKRQNNKLKKEEEQLKKQHQR
jgi:hypothetical protein